MTEEMNEEYQDRYMTPEEFANNAAQEGQFVILVWDSDKRRLGARIEELMKLGYQPVGNMEAHTVYRETSRGSGNTIPVKQDLCILMMNKTLFQEFFNPHNARNSE